MCNALLEALPQRIFFKDRRSVYVAANSAYADDLGVRPEDLRGKSDHDFYPGSLADKYRTEDLRIMEALQPRPDGPDYTCPRR